MFKKTTKSHQLDLYSSPDTLLSGKSLTFYETDQAWHNLFRKQVIMRIDEDIFKPLFTDGKGAPNAAVRVLVGMMVLKEANGWSDAQLFEQCRYNLLIRSALGLMNMDDNLPVESTYYLFRKRIVDWEKSTDQNLIESSFSAITKGQVVDFEVSGKSIRMDSKLMGSNLSWYSRYEIIHQTLRLLYEDVKGSISAEILLGAGISTAEIELLRSLLTEDGSKVVYRSDRLELGARMLQLGRLSQCLLALVTENQSAHYQTLKSVFEEQFNVGDTKEVLLRPKEEISSGSVQSPHDTDCHYRDKDGNKVKGYSINISETCDKDKLNLITDIQTEVVSTPDVDFLVDAITQSQSILLDKIEKLHTDGAYHSPENQTFCQGENIDFILNAIQGPVGRYELSYDEDNNLVVTDTKTNQKPDVRKVISKKDPNQIKWAIKDAQKAYRYFTLEQIQTSLLRQKIKLLPQSLLNVRNNVEATIFQLGYHYPNDKSNYRGIIKHKMWANIRCMWINFVRILNHLTKPGQRTYGTHQNRLKQRVYSRIFILNLFLHLTPNPIKHKKHKFI